MSNEEVKTQAASLGGATMPTGQKITPKPKFVPSFGSLWKSGKYFTDEVFEPAFRFEAPGVIVKNYESVWQVNAQSDESDGLVLWIDPWPEGGQLTFTRPLHVFDPTNPSDPKEVPAPENTDEWVSWFQNHPSLETSKPAPVSIGGASGMLIDVTSTSTLENYPRDDCVEPCVFLYPATALKCCYPPETSGASIHPGSMRLYKETKDRYIIVDVKGEMVVINVSAPAEKFDEFLPNAQKVLKTVEWEGAQAPSSGEDAENTGP